MPSLTECIFVLNSTGLSFSVKTDVPMRSIMLATLHNTATTHRKFELWNPDRRYVGHVPLPSEMMPDAVSFIVTFPDGASDSCSAKQLALGKVHDCMETDRFA